MAAGVTKRLWEMKEVVDMLEAWKARRFKIDLTLVLVRNGLA